MSDIIKEAQQLLEDATPGPWEHYSDHGIVSLASGDAAIATDLNGWDADLIAAAPENTQALAEETYFYGVQVWMGGRWIMMLTSRYGTSLTHKGKWFEHKHEAEECADTWSHDTPTRIVFQRRSPVEVINE